MATLNDDSKKTVDVDKEMLMEVRGIIDGCIESGSVDYKTALEEIAANVNEHLFPKDKVPDGLESY